MQVVLAPCLADVAYKRLRNLGYGSFVLPDLQVGVACHLMAACGCGFVGVISGLHRGCSDW
jgi:hypothetical protein